MALEVVTHFINTHLTSHISQINIILYICMVVGMITSSISGVLRSIEARMDITGAILLAFVNANAGGTVRDLILGTKVFWIEDQFYIWIALIVGMCTFILIRYNTQIIDNQKLHKALVITDAMGLTAFCLAGVQKTMLVYGASNLYVLPIMMGMWTAVGGGIAADVIANRIPLVFSDSELYITVAFVGAVLFLFLTVGLDMNIAIASIFATVVMVTLRLYSVKYKITLPIIHHRK